MVSKERIKRIKTWLDNGSFTKCNPFFNDHIEHIWNYCNYIGYEFEPLKDKKLPTTTWQQITQEEMIILAQEYFIRHNIKINIEELLKNKTLEIVPLKETKEIVSSLGYVNNSDGTIKIKVSNDNTIFSVGILIHELLHYLNEPTTKRSFTSDLFTEIPSYYNELIFFLELNNTKYQKDSLRSIILIQRLIYKEAYILYTIYKMLYVYFQTKDISKESYEKLFDDNQYEKSMEILNEYTIQRRSILRDTWTFIASPFYINYFMKYQENPSSFETITELSNKLNEYNISDCMIHLGYPTLEDFIDQTKEYTTKFISLINSYFSKLENTKEIS